MRGDEERRWSEAPRTSQKARAIHSAWVKWPGKAGTSFMSRRSAATRMPREVRARERRLRSTRKNETQVASQPKAEAMEPTSVTGTRRASPRSKPAMVAAAIGEQQAAGSDEVSVEALEESEEGHHQNEADGPAGAEGLLEGKGGGEALADDVLPGRDVADGDYGERVESGADEQGQGDGAHVARALEFWIGLFGAFGRGLETSEEVRNDLQGKQDGDEGAGAEEGLKI